MLLIEYYFEGDFLGPQERILVDNHIYLLKVNPDGTLVPISTFGKKGKSKGQFDAIGSAIIKGDYFFIAEYNLLEQLGGKPGNHRLQILKIASDSKVLFVSVFGKKGEKAGEFYFPSSLVIKDNYLYVADWGNSRIQALEIKY